MLKNAKPLRIPIPYKGQLGFFDVRFTKNKIKKEQLIQKLLMKNIDINGLVIRLIIAKKYD